MSTFLDVHCHMLPDPHVSAKYLDVQFGTAADPDEVIYRGGSVGSIRQELTDADAAVAVMDRTGIDQRAMSISPLSYRYDLYAQDGLAWHAGMNDALAVACARHPERLVPIAMVPMQDGKLAAGETSRAVNDLSMRGVEIGTHVAGRNLDDPGLEPFWERVEELNVPVFIHPEHTPHARLTDYYTINLVGNPVESGIAVASLIFGGVLDRHPGLRFWVAHGGGIAPWIAGRLRHGWSVRREPHLHRVSDPMELLARHFWWDTLAHDPGTTAALADRFGLDRLVLGSDAPFDMGDPDCAATLRQAVALRRSDDTDVDAVDVVYRTGRALLGLDSGPTA